MKYVDISTAANKAVFLGNYTTLDATKRAKAEQLAELEIDRALRKWDRSLWSPDTTPPDVAAVALKITSAFYIRMSVAASNPLADPDNVRTWLKEARAELRELASSSFLVGYDGEPIYPERPEHNDGVIDIFG